MNILKKTLIVAVMSLTFGAYANAAPVLIKFAHVVAPVGNPKGEAATEFAARVNKELAGKAEVQVFPSSQLYNDDEVLSSMLLGDVHMAAPSLSKFESYTKKFRVFDLPFLFNDIEAVDRFQTSKIGQDLLKSMESKGLLGLTYWHNGLKQLSANKPLVKPADAKGLKFRIQTSDVIQAQFEAVGANPQKMAFAEVYQALQTGIVDGQENTWSNIYTRKFYEVQDGVTESNHGLLDYLVVTSARFWNGIEKNLRSDIEKILHEVTKKFNDKASEINAQNRAKIIAEGHKVRQLSASDRAAWATAMRPVWKKFEKDVKVKPNKRTTIQITQLVNTKKITKSKKKRLKSK